MKRTLRRLALLSVAMVLGFASCEKKLNSIAGHDYVDLGLPSGTKWATCNVGATAPHEYGNYYAWGETTTKSTYSSENSRTYGVSMNDISCNPTYDATRADWGSTWRLPTEAEMEELKDNCTWTWTTQKGVNGCTITGPNGNSLFLPAAGFRNGSSHCFVGELGCYWSSTPNESDGNYAYYLRFDSGGRNVGWDSRLDGHTVRPVSE